MFYADCGKEQKQKTSISKMTFVSGHDSPQIANVENAFWKSYKFVDNLNFVLIAANNFGQEVM